MRICRLWIYNWTTEYAQIPILRTIKYIHDTPFIWRFVERGNYTSKIAGRLWLLILTSPTWYATEFYVKPLCEDFFLTWTKYIIGSVHDAHFIRSYRSQVQENFWNQAQNLRMALVSNSVEKRSMDFSTKWIFDQFCGNLIEACRRPDTPAKVQGPRAVVSFGCIPEFSSLRMGWSWSQGLLNRSKWTA